MKRFITLLSLIVMLSANLTAATRSSKQEISQQLEIFTSLFKALQTNYVDTIDVKKSMTTAITGMLEDIDPYTNYFTEEEQKDFMTMTTGVYGGIGSMIMQRDGNVYVSEPYKDTPSSLAGLRAGDMFVMIDTDTVTGWTSDKVSAKLKGQAGTPVRIVVKRPFNGADSILTFDIVRSKIEIPSVPYYGVTAGNVGYIKLTTFSENSGDDVRQAVQELKGDPRVKSLMLDLRSNGGGLLEEAVKIVGLFVPKGTEVVHTRGRGQLNEKIYKTTHSPLDTEIPIAVLVDGNTASAAEIVTGALQDLDRAVVLGQRTYGKGLVQSTSQLPYGGMLKVTIAKYYIPSGRLIQAIDYSHRNPDGTAGRIPDSLTTVYHTRAGREVRDGGGITPDIVTDINEPARITYNLVTGNSVFDFATEWVASHPTIERPDAFTVNDTIFAAFKESVNPDKVQYDRFGEMFVDELEKMVKKEGYINDSVQTQIDVLRRLLHHDLMSDIDLHRDEISKYIGSELLTRYYYTPGVIEWQLPHDTEIEKAAAILNDPQQYRSILNK